jgi:CRP-like cAMP-binding protein
MSVVKTTNGEKMESLEKKFKKIKENSLFKGISFGEFEKVITCMLAKTVTYKKNDTIWLTGASTQFLGLLMSGSVRVIKSDPDGNDIILADSVAPDFLGDIGVWAGLPYFPITVKANTDCEVIFLESRKVTSLCSSNCIFHTRMLEQMLRTISKKAFILDQKVEILSKRTIRKKLIQFFEAQRGFESKFTLPYNREEMARYLCVDRSALSYELSKMRDEGLIRYRRNEFEIL